MFLAQLLFTTCFIAILPGGLANKTSVLDDVVTGSENNIFPYLGVTYKLVKSDKYFDEVLKALGISWAWRKLYEAAKPTFVLMFNSDVDEYVFSERSILFDEGFVFQLGNKFWRRTIDGRPIVDRLTVEGDTLSEVQTSKDGKLVLQIERQFSSDHLNVTLKVNDIVSHRVFDKVHAGSTIHSPNSV